MIWRVILFWWLGASFAWGHCTGGEALNLSRRLAEVTNGMPSWTGARVTAFGAVPGYRPVAYGNGVDLVQLSPLLGHEVDTTGLYYFHYRYYDPVSGQWLSYDPMWNELDPNGQSFCAGNPVKFTDPQGLMSKGAGQAATTALSSIGGLLKNSYFSISYGLADLTYGQNQANQMYGQYLQGLRQTVTGTAQTVYDTAAFASFELLSPIAPQQSAQAYGPSIDRLYNVDTSMTGGQGNSTPYRTGYTMFSAATFVMGGQIGNLGRVTGAGRIGPTAAETGSQTLFHYTSEDGLAGILDSGELNPSLKALNPNDVRYGNGQYLSDIAPGTKTSAQLSREFIGQPFQGQKYTHFIEIDVSGLNAVQGRAGVFVIPGETPLDLTGRIISHGAN